MTLSASIAGGLASEGDGCENGEAGGGNGRAVWCRIVER
jgi:hypothetical protein